MPSGKKKSIDEKNLSISCSQLVYPKIRADYLFMYLSMYLFICVLFIHLFILYKIVLFQLHMKVKYELV